MQHGIVTQASVEYRGSLTLDPLIMEALDVREYEQVHVNNASNGHRDVTYVIAGERGSGVIGINGALALRHSIGDNVHLLFYCLTDQDVQPIII